MSALSKVTEDRALTWGEVEAHAEKLRVRRGRAYRCGLACAVLLSLDPDDFDALMKNAPRPRRRA